MIDFGLSDDYLNGYNTRLKSEPFDRTESDEWQFGWMNADQALKMWDERETLDERQQRL